MHRAIAPSGQVEVDEPSPVREEHRDHAAIPADEVQPKDTHTGTLLFLAFGLLFTLIGFVLSAWRWQRVFAIFDRHVSLRTLLNHYLAGQFVGNVLPSTDSPR